MGRDSLRPERPSNDHLHLVVNLVGWDGQVADANRTGIAGGRVAWASKPASGYSRPHQLTRLRRSRPSRDHLRQIVRTAAIPASAVDEFIALVRENGECIQLRWSAAGQLSGRATGRPQAVRVGVQSHRFACLSCADLPP